MSIVPVENRPLPNLPTDEQGLRQLEIWLQNNTTIIRHGHDHRCGGLDPVPNMCELETLLAGGSLGNYVSQQTGRWTDYVNSSRVVIATWPAITVTGIQQNLLAGNWLHARWSATNYLFQNVPLILGGPSWNATFSWTTADPPIQISADGYIYNPPAGTVTTSNIYTYPDTATYQMEAYGTPFPTVQGYIEHGVLFIEWVTAGGTPGTGTGTGSLYPGAYPITNLDVSATANIDPTKLSIPGTTTTFLRGDGAFTAANIQVEY